MVMAASFEVAKISAQGGGQPRKATEKKTLLVVEDDDDDGLWAQAKRDKLSSGLAANLSHSDSQVFVFVRNTNKDSLTAHGALALLLPKCHDICTTLWLSLAASV